MNALDPQAAAVLAEMKKRLEASQSGDAGKSAESDSPEVQNILAAMRRATGATS